MIARALLAVVLCGMAAGLVMAWVQHKSLTPLILQAETYEHAEGHDHSTHVHDPAAWQPKDGLERTLFTTLTSLLAATGFAALLAGVAFVTATPINRTNGWIWGLCGFVAVALAPAVGLPPELPGMDAADVTSRQIWWVFAILATATGLWVIAHKKLGGWLFLALFLLVLPHIIGAPQPAELHSEIPANLAATFTTLSLGANALMWLIIGMLLGFALPSFEWDKAS
jgi:cobalt transporter subunit CbtA